MLTQSSLASVSTPTAKSMTDLSFPSTDPVDSSPNYGKDGDNTSSNDTDNHLPGLSLETNSPLVFQAKIGCGHQSRPFDSQISTLTDNSDHATENINQDTIRSSNKNRTPHQSRTVTQLFQEPHVVQNKSIDSQSTGSVGFFADHVGLSLTDLRVENNSSPLTNTEKSAETFEGQPCKVAPRPSQVDTAAFLSRSGVNLESRSSTFNLFPKTLIESNDLQLEHLDNLPRLVHRNRAFHQSSNKVFIKHNQGTKIFKLLRFNWFHVFLRWKTKWSLLVLLSVWTLAILFFALLYVGYDNIKPEQTCGLGAENQPIYFAGAFAFSLETCTTVGYGLPNGTNAFFEPRCSGLQVIIFIQMVWSMVFNAFLITFLYNRVGRSETRGTQIVYSSKALVSLVDGQVRFQIRLFDCDARHPVVEAHVRLYCVMKHRPVPRPLRLLQPNDELGGTLFLSFPTVVCHNIDMYSLLHPPRETMLMKPNGLVLRQVDGATGNRDDVCCPVCGESFGTFERWANHVRYQQIIEECDDLPIDGTHRAVDMSELEAQPGIGKRISDLEQLKEHFRRNVSEILCLVEGIDPMQSGSFQALQSYRFEDIVWERYSQFSPCLSLEKQFIPSTAENKIFSVDLDRFHDIIPDPEAAVAAANAATEEMAAHLEAAGMAKLAKTGEQRKRHRRIKTLSNRTSDSLFTPTPQHDNNTKVAKILAQSGIETV
ncbi:inward rectifier potassium channel [Nitzschia inconspicua]|uniref:Inward rectifier potassium channel n=1 Tax=Nitzschia inconspicua TaxID=303405 RepID=A0A9K3KCQ5_9STRA|nr:inward rectifier potassium channel [Nitzschia inconspicua]